MEKINDFLRQRDELNCKCTYDLKKDEYVSKNRSRTGDKLIISNSKGILDGKGEHKVLIQKIILIQLKTNAFLWQ